MRIEFGYDRTRCGCRACRTNCMHMPGFLIPADLDRLIPPDIDPLAWAEENLLASPGAKVMKGGEVFRIPTLVPAVKPDGSCIHFTGGKNGLCKIHENAPFGCAFFDCGPKPMGLSESGLVAIYTAPEYGLYKRIWRHLDSLGKRQQSAEVLRKRIADELGVEKY